MDPVLKYLSDPFIETVSTEKKFRGKNVDSGYSELEKLQASDKEVISPLKLRRSIIETDFPILPGPGQIWLCKQRYVDDLGNDIQANIPGYVLITKGPSTLETSDVGFVRVQPISMYTEYGSADDVTVKDPSIIGFPFLIEKWNEQPMLTRLLDIFIADLADHEEVISCPGRSRTVQEITDSQKQFRRLEVRNTAWLRQSVLSALSWLENRQEERSGGVLINLFGKTVYPERQDTGPAGDGLLIPMDLAAKSRVGENSTPYVCHETIGQHSITIAVIKEDRRHRVEVTFAEHVDLFDPEGNRCDKRLEGSTSIFLCPKPGMYELVIQGCDMAVRIRVE
jgi:hypothetical protein